MPLAAVPSAALLRSRARTLAVRRDTAEALADAWQAERHFRQALDRWLIESSREFPDANTAVLTDLRALGRRTQEQLAARIRALGRTVARVPVVNSEPRARTSPPGGVRRLVVLRRINARAGFAAGLEALRVQRLGDFDSAECLRALGELCAERDRCFRELFAAGQRCARIDHAQAILRAA